VVIDLAHPDLVKLLETIQFVKTAKDYAPKIEQFSTGRMTPVANIEKFPSPKPMTRDCTHLFVRYRDIARAVWNLGFCGSSGLCNWNSIGPYEEAMARFFEAMILQPLGSFERIKNPYNPGGAVEIIVQSKTPQIGLLVERNRPGGAEHHWGGADAFCRL
jgi:hypothetical protein